MCGGNIMGHGELGMNVLYLKSRLKSKERSCEVLRITVDVPYLVHSSDVHDHLFVQIH